MATRTRTFWTYWDCTSCDTKHIRGDNKRCPDCGNPRETEELAAESLGRDIDPVSGKVLANDNIVDVAELAEALSGADWHCSNCGSGNRNLDANCISCSNPRYEVENPEYVPQQEPDYGSEPVQSQEPAWQRTWRDIPKDPEPNFSYSAPPPDKTNQYLMIAGGVLAAFLFIWGIVWCMTTHDVKGTVTTMTWQHIVYRDTFSKVKDSDWEDRITLSAPVMPVNGSGERAGATNVRNCTQQHYDDRTYVCGSERKCDNKTRQVASGSHEVCSTSSNRNGSATETCHDVTDYRTEHYEDCRNVDKMCTEPIYKNHCDYDTYKWVLAQTVNGGGQGTENLVWPDPAVGPVDRLRHEEHYGVTFSYTDGEPDTYTLTTNSQSEYLTWQKGMVGVLSIRNIGTVAEVKHL